MAGGARGGVGVGGVGRDGGGRSSDLDPSSGIAFGMLASSFACWRRWVERDGASEELRMTTMMADHQPPNAATVGGAGGAPAATTATRAADAAAGDASRANPPAPPRRCPADPGSHPGVKFTRSPPAIAVGDAVEVVVRGE